MRVNLPITQTEYVIEEGALIVSKTDTKGRITYVNPDFIEASGFIESELIGKAHNIVRHPDMPPEAFSDLWETLQAGKPWTGMVKNRRRNGDYYWVLANATPIRDGATVTGFMSVRTRPSRDQIQEAESLYRQFRDSKTHGLAIREGAVVKAGKWRHVASLTRLPVSWQAGLGTSLAVLPGLVALGALAMHVTALPVLVGGILAASGVAGVAVLGRLIRRLVGTIRGSKERIDGMTQGKFERVFEAVGEDELADLQRALQSLRTKVGFELADGEQRAADATRIRVALDNVTTSVMVADPDGTIIYANEAVLTLFRKQSDEIRKHLPQFEVDKVLGNNIDAFHKNPAHQRGILSSLSGSRTADISLGEARLRVIASPVVNSKGERLGTVAQWIDRTAEVSTEKEIQFVVDAANQGDLTRRIRSEGKEGFFSMLAAGINSMLEANANLVRDAQEAAREVTGSADEISKGNMNLSQRTEEQASSLEETASSMEEMTSTVKQNADNAAQANQLAAAARAQAEKGGAVVSEAVAAMQGINAASNKIADIIGVIDEIAFQTNLLALNAAVEAARAGEQGRGFAVVASEVRTLASRSAEAAKEIKALIQDSVGKVAHGSKLVDASGQTLSEIVASVKKVSDIVSEIAAASAEQSSGIEQVNRAVTSMDEVTQQNAALVEEASAAAESLLDQAQQLHRMMAKYRVTDESAPAWDGTERRRDDAWLPESVDKRPVAKERRAPNRSWSKAASAPPAKVGPSAAAPASLAKAAESKSTKSARKTGTEPNAEWDEF